MVRKPKCQYCGAYMELQCIEKIGKWNYWCPECGSESPVKDNEKDAYSAADVDAFKKPLTKEEMYMHKAVWIEHFTGQVRPMVIERFQKLQFLETEYGYKWRAWLGFPSEKLRKETPWQQPSVLEVGSPKR